MGPTKMTLTQCPMVPSDQTTRFGPPKQRILRLEAVATPHPDLTRRNVVTECYSTTRFNPKSWLSQRHLLLAIGGLLAVSYLTLTANCPGSVPRRLASTEVQCHEHAPELMQSLFREPLDNGLRRRLPGKQVAPPKPKPESTKPKPESPKKPAVTKTETTFFSTKGT